MAGSPTLMGECRSGRQMKLMQQNKIQMSFLKKKKKLKLAGLHFVQVVRPFI